MLQKVRGKETEQFGVWGFKPVAGNLRAGCARDLAWEVSDLGKRVPFLHKRNDQISLRVGWDNAKKEHFLVSLLHFIPEKQEKTEFLQNMLWDESPYFYNSTWWYPTSLCGLFLYSAALTSKVFLTV